MNDLFQGLERVFLPPDEIAGWNKRNSAATECQMGLIHRALSIEHFSFSIPGPLPHYKNGK